MVKKKSFKKQKPTFKKGYILWLAILILVVAQCLSIWQIMKLRENAKYDSKFQMRILLKNTEEDRYKYPIIDVAENRVYIPEAHIYLPLNEVSRNLRYNYEGPSTGASPTVLHLSVSSAVGKQYNEQYASCDSILLLTPPTSALRTVMKPTANIEPTKDGFTDIYLNSDTTCWNQKWYTDQKQGLLEVAKEIKNY